MPHRQKVFGAALVFVGVVQATRIKALLGRPLLRTLGDLSFSIYLVHWPVIFGVVPMLLQRMTPTLGAATAPAIAVVVGVPVTLLVAKGFSYVDRAAIAASRGIRRAL
ncbi:MAG: acyltransferase family protein [Deltaproteobacteria bacterium]|nr:acyltransferase family protein [Deltaproteobacteria bacterium]